MKKKCYAEGGEIDENEAMAKRGELPQAMVDRMRKQENKEDRELIMAPARAAGRAAKAVGDKVKQDLTGGAYTGARLNMPSNTRLGKLSAADTRLLNKTDAMKKNPYATEREAEFKKGGKVSKAVMQKAGFYDKSKSKKERQEIVEKVTTKPQRVAIVEKAFSTKQMKEGGSVSSASKRADGCAIRGKTKA
jgi:hypothetical protein